jgi:hypothetical protein
MKYSKQSKIAGLLIFIFMSFGIYAGILGIDRIENYRHPYLFVTMLGIIGIGFGILLGYFIKPFMKLNSKQLKNFFSNVMFICFGTIGLMIAIGNMLNSKFSKIESCDNWSVYEKEYFPYKYRSPSASYLYVENKGKKECVKINHKYWLKIYINDKIKICTYKSSLGFDYLEVPFEK